MIIHQQRSETVVLCTCPRCREVLTATDVVEIVGVRWMVCGDCGEVFVFDTKPEPAVAVQVQVQVHERVTVNERAGAATKKLMIASNDLDPDPDPEPADSMRPTAIDIDLFDMRADDPHTMMMAPERDGAPRVERQIAWVSAAALVAGLAVGFIASATPSSASKAAANSTRSTATAAAVAAARKPIPNLPPVMNLEPIVISAMPTEEELALEAAAIKGELAKDGSQFSEVIELDEVVVRPKVTLVNEPPPPPSFSGARASLKQLKAPDVLKRPEAATVALSKSATF